MKFSRFVYLIVLLSVAFAVIAQAFGYGITFAATTLAMQIPLLVIVFCFARDAERSGRRKIFVCVSLLLSVIFLASGGENIVLCVQYGILHASDSGETQIGNEMISVVLLVGVAASWWVHRLCQRAFPHEEISKGNKSSTK